jgi:hypothetical protein
MQKPNRTPLIEDTTKKLEALTILLEKDAQKPLPEIEKLPIHFYEEGIIGLDGALSMREIVALQHWKGNKNYTFYDLIRNQGRGH